MDTVQMKELRRKRFYSRLSWARDVVRVMPVLSAACLGHLRYPRVTMHRSRNDGSCLDGERPLALFRHAGLDIFGCIPVLREATIDDGWPGHRRIGFAVIAHFSRRCATSYASYPPTHVLPPANAGAARPAVFGSTRRAAK